MSFLSAVGHFLQGTAKVANALEPFAPLIRQAPGPAGLILDSIIQVEALAGAGRGVDKKAAVLNLVSLAYPGINKEVLSKSVDSFVAGLNALAESLADSANPQG